MKDMGQKALVNATPVAATDRVIIPEEIAEDVYECYKAEATMVYLHVRDKEGDLTKDMTLLEEILAVIGRDSDIMIEVSTGGVSNLTIEERCAPLYSSLAEACFLNMGSTNLGKTVYCSPMDDMEHCVREMLRQERASEVETFEAGHTWAMTQLMKKYGFANSVLFNVVLGHEGKAPAIPQALATTIQMIPAGTIWGIAQVNRRDFSLLAEAVGVGAKTVRIGSKDGNYLSAVTQTDTSAPLVAKTVRMLQAMDKEPITSGEAREFFGIGE